MCYALSIHLVRAKVFITVAGEALQGVVAGEVGKLLCRVWDDDGSADALLERTYGKNGAAVIGAPIRYSKKVFRDAFCFPFDGEPSDEPGYSPYGTEPQLGQCPVIYNFKGALGIRNKTTLAERSVTFSIGSTIGSTRRWGPWRGFRIDQRPNGSSMIGLHSNQDGSPGETTLGSIGSGEEYISSVLTSATRFDGQPDNCGGESDPRPRYDGPVTYPDGASRPTTIIINNPQNNKGGRGITVPFAWISPELNVSGKATINPKGELEIDLNGGDDGSFAVDPNSPQPAPGPDSPPSPEGYREMRGVVVVTTKIASATTTTEYGNGESPNLYLPRCASLLFAVNVIGNGNWTQPVDIETLRQWVPVLGDLPAYLAVAKPMNGYSCQLYPVYVDDEKDEPIDDE